MLFLMLFFHFRSAASQPRASAPGRIQPVVPAAVKPSEPAKAKPAEPVAVKSVWPETNKPAPSLGNDEPTLMPAFLKQYK